MSKIYVDEIAGIASPSTVAIPGHVIQVVTNSTNTTVTSTAITYTDTGLTASITPTSTSSKIFVITNQMFRVQHATSSFGGFRLLRDSTVIHDPTTQSGIGPYEFGSFTSFHYGRANIILVDEPNTTSSVTYKTMQASYDTDRITSTQYSSGPGDVAGTSYITIMEIAG